MTLAPFIADATDPGWLGDLIGGQEDWHRHLNAESLTRGWGALGKNHWLYLFFPDRRTSAWEVWLDGEEERTPTSQSTLVVRLGDGYPNAHPLARPCAGIKLRLPRLPTAVPDPTAFYAPPPWELIYPQPGSIRSIDLTQTLHCAGTKVQIGLELVNDARLILKPTLMESSWPEPAKWRTAQPPVSL